MKQNKNIFSSLLVALLAGFIYFQLGGVEDIEKIASFGYQLISNPTEEINSNKVAVNGNLIEKNVTKKETQPELFTSEENQLDMEQGMIELAVATPISKYISTYPDDYYKINVSTDATAFLKNNGDFAVNTEHYISKKIKKNKNDLRNIRTRENNTRIDVIASLDDFHKSFIPVRTYNDDDDPVTIIVNDSDYIKLNIEKLELDKFNVKLNVAMEKLNIAIGKLTDNLKDMDFNFNNEENKAEFKIKMKEFEVDMKEFEKEMKELDIKEDMEEFKEDMKEFKRELKKNLKEQKREKRRERENHIDS